MLNDKILEIAGLVVRYGSHTVLDGVSLQAGKTERIALLGRSGAGKTTLLRSINGFAPVSAGSVKVNGADITKLRKKALRAARSHIGVVSQRHDLVDMLSTHQNVMAGALGRWSSWRALRFLMWPFESELEEDPVGVTARGPGAQTTHTGLEPFRGRASKSGDCARTGAGAGSAAGG